LLLCVWCLRCLWFWRGLWILGFGKFLEIILRSI